MAEPSAGAQTARSTGRRSSARPSSRSSSRRRRRFVIPGTIFFLSLVPRLHPAVRATRPTSWARASTEGLTVGYCLALTQFVMVFVLGLWYLRKSDNEFDPLAAKAIEAYADDEQHPAPGASSATARGAPAATTEEVGR